ncbi:Arm DNA-binding domain-containing protein [Orientia tsutsugamushi]|uniref:Arm DNA-binding domain-containing protein n=1 Tax=Orientia tsutsugamushi TaxID=784 RepID=UPI0011BAB8BD
MLLPLFLCSNFIVNDYISKIKPPKEKRDVYRDTKDKGLFLEVLYGGTKTLYLGITIKGVYRKIKLGNFPNISVNYARKKR